MTCMMLFLDLRRLVWLRDQWSLRHNVKMLAREQIREREAVDPSVGRERQLFLAHMWGIDATPILLNFEREVANSLA